MSPNADPNVLRYKFGLGNDNDNIAPSQYCPYQFYKGVDGVANWEAVEITTSIRKWMLWGGGGCLLKNVVLQLPSSVINMIERSIVLAALLLLCNGSVLKTTFQNNRDISKNPSVWEREDGKSYLKKVKKKENTHSAPSAILIIRYHGFKGARAGTSLNL
eukprot:gene24735-208_t